MIKGTFSITTKIKCSAVNFVFFLVILALKINGQTSVAGVRMYIETHADEAIYQMVEYKIPASVTLAQAIFESSCGTSVLAKRSNNHFGINVLSCYCFYSSNVCVYTFYYISFLSR